MLLTFAKAEALRRGYRSIYLSTNAEMTESLVFYPQIGYVEYKREQEAGADGSSMPRILHEVVRRSGKLANICCVVQVQ